MPGRAQAGVSRIALAIIAAVAVVAVGTVLVVAGVRSGSTGCSLAAPAPDLPPELRALGDFGQAYPAGDAAAVSEAATRIAGTVDRELLGATAATPVLEHAPDAAHHDAYVVPLVAPQPGAAGTRVVGLVVFLDDCAGRHYYDSYRDLLSGHDPQSLPQAYPSVDAAAASARLGGDVQLSYASDPARPVWRAGGGATLPAA